jgi:hypothetical protein
MCQSKAKAAALFGALWRSPALQVVALYGVSGLGFSGANLLLARFLPTHDYATLVLVLSLITLAVPLAPLGLQGVVVRQRLAATPQLLFRGMMTGIGCGLAVAAVARFVYQLHSAHLVIIVLAIVGGGVAQLAAALFSTQERFLISVVLSQGANCFLLLGTLIAGFEYAGTSLPLAVLVLGQITLATWGWLKLIGENPVAVSDQRFYWTEALLLTSVAGAAELMLQLERLMIPKLLTLEDLATFAVLAAVVISPFRLLQMSVARTLVPRLRNAMTISARRRLLIHEAAIVHGMALVGCAAIWYLMPVLSDWVLRAKYHFSAGLMLAAIASGLIRVLSGFANAAVTALASSQRLAVWNLWSWILVAVGGIGAIIGARWGLTGVICGAMLGWACRIVVAASIVLPQLKEHTRRPADACR